MAVLNSQSVDQFGADNMRGNTVKNVGKPRQKSDALTWGIPSYTTTERDAIPDPTAGLLIYNSTTQKLNFYDATGWRAVTST